MLLVLELEVIVTEDSRGLFILIDDILCAAKIVQVSHILNFLSAIVVNNVPIGRYCRSWIFLFTMLLLLLLSPNLFILKSHDSLDLSVESVVKVI